MTTNEKIKKAAISLFEACNENDSNCSGCVLDAIDMDCPVCDLREIFDEGW